MQNKIKYLKYRIDKNIDELQKDIELTQTISEAIEGLIMMDANNALINAWLRGIDDIILSIENKLKEIEKN